jgi:hypothetical protein
MYSGMTHDLQLPPDGDSHPRAGEGHRSLLSWRGLDASLHSFLGITAAVGPAVGPAGVTSAQQPANISATDFRTLQSRMLSNGLAFAAKDSSIQNNLSVVLLIEWKTRRLLFVGDASGTAEFKDGKQNSSWNVMWNKHRKTHLKAPLDFLKIGHHGSINATRRPPQRANAGKPAADSVYAILDTILPVPKAGAKPTAQAIVSTEREFYNPIPECKVLVDLARRVSARVRRRAPEEEGHRPEDDLGVRRRSDTSSSSITRRTS